MSAIYERVKDMNRSDKMAYFKTITPEEKKAYNNFSNLSKSFKTKKQ